MHPDSLLGQVTAQMQAAYPDYEPWLIELRVRYIMALLMEGYGDA